MTESFDYAMKVMRENLAGMYANGHMTKWGDVDTSVDLDCLQRAHEHELEQARDPQRIGGTFERGSFEYAIEQLREFRWQHATNDEDAIPYINNVARAHEQARKAEYARGYEDGRRSKDADHAAVALRLSRLKFDGGSHENLSRIAYAIYPCATGWTCDSSKGLRDRLIDLLGGVHEHCCDTGRDCACGDSRARGVGEPAKTITYDALGNERHKAACELQKLDGCSPLAHGFRDALAAAIDVPRDGTPYDDKELCHLICDRLIYLLGGNEKYFYLSVREDGSIDSRKSVEEADELIGDVRRRADQSHESSPMRLENETGITTEFREAIETATKTYEGSWYEMDDADHTICHITEGELLGIADRIDEQLASVCEQRDLARSEVIELRDGYYKLKRKLYEIEDVLDG